MSDEGLRTIPSAFSVRETIDRLERIAASRGLRVFARVDHAAGAADVGMALRPTELVLLGNPRGGTPLMQDRQTVGIDLPLRVLAWEDAEGCVWLTCDEMAWVARRHGLGSQSAGAIAALSVVLQSITMSAASDTATTIGM